MAVIDAEIEGRITDADPAGAGAMLTVVGVSVLVPDGTEIRTPTKLLTVAELLDPTPFPGRAEDGFIGGTAIVEGTFDTATGLLTATSVEVEPAENLLLGALTAFAPATINLVPVVLLPEDEPRLPADPLVNEFGFPVVMNDKVLDQPAAADGYYDGAIFRAYHMEVAATADLVSNDPQIVITRAQFQERDPADERGDSFDIRGAVTMMHAPPGVTLQLIEVFRLDGGVATSLGQTEAERDPEFPRFARWRMDGQTAPTFDPVLGLSPARVRATNLSDDANLASAESETDIA